MNRLAVIDIGSNSVRLMFVADGKVLYKTLETTRLGEGLTKAPVLTDGGIERSAIAVRDFYEKAKREGAEQVFAFATAAVRLAENKEAFLTRVKELCGLTVEVVSGEEEAELGILGALGDQDGGIVDIGGASTEFILRKGGEIVYKKSVDVGVVRLKESCGKDEKLLKNACEKAVQNFEKIENGYTVYAIGGTATTLAAVSLGLKIYDAEKVTGAKLSLSDVDGLLKKFLSSSVEEIAKIPCVPLKRADVITGGAALLKALMERLELPFVVVSDRDNLEGYAQKHGGINL